MKWVLLLVVVAGVALAEEQKQEEEEKSAGRLLSSATGLKAAVTSFLGVVSSGFSLAAQIVILIALILLISKIKEAKDGQDATGYDYEYYHAPAYEQGGYDNSGGGSSYASGYSKRSADFPSFLNIPIVQRLTEKIHSAIEKYTEMQQ